MRHLTLALLLLAAPLSAQTVTQVDTLGITVTQTHIINGDSIYINLEVLIGKAPCDSACVAREALGDSLTRAFIASCNCVSEVAPSTPVVISVASQAAFLVLGFFAVRYLKQIGNNLAHEPKEHAEKPEKSVVSQFPEDSENGEHE